MAYPLSKLHQSFVEEVEHFAGRNIVPLLPQLDRPGGFPDGLWLQLGKAGLLGITVPVELGGRGLGYLAQVLLLETLSRYSPSVALSVGAHDNLCINQICLFANEEQKERYLPLLTAGTWVGALAMSERNAGSDVMSMGLTATPLDEGFELTGHKMWITNGPDADLLVVYARHPELSDIHGITAFLFETDQSGFRRGPPLDKLGMRGSNTCELFFENCWVPYDNVLGQIGAGAGLLYQGLTIERAVLAGGPLGILARCLEHALEHARERHQFGKPIGEFQLIKQKLADIYCDYCACQAWIYQTAEALDHGQVDPKQGAGTILFTAERATRAALEGIQVLGGYGYLNEELPGMLLRDAKLYEIGAGTSEMRRLLIADRLLKGDPW